MDQKALYEVVRKCGAKVILFSDHPDFFHLGQLES